MKRKLTALALTLFFVMTAWCGRSFADDYDLTVNVNDSNAGTISVSVPSDSISCGPAVSCTESVDDGAVDVTISADDADGWEFVDWSDATLATNPVTFPMGAANRTVTANFQRIIYTLDTEQTGSGTVTSDTTYEFDDGLAVVASPADGWEFVDWTGPGTGNLDDGAASTTIINPTYSNTSVTANFQRIIYTLDTEQTGSGTVTSDTTYEFDDGLAVLASPADGWEFVDWTGPGAGNLVDDGAASTTIINPTYSNTSVTANFQRIIYTLDTEQTGSGTVTSDTTYEFDDGLAVVASPADGWEFVDWTGPGTGNLDDGAASTTIINPTYSNTSVTANFQRIIYTLDTEQTGNGTVTPDTTYEYDDGLAVVASPADGWEFVDWTGTGAGNLVDDGAASTTIINPTYSNTSVTANFQRIIYTLDTEQIGVDSSVTSDTTYEYDDGLEVVASPAGDEIFLRWEGNTENLQQTDYTLETINIRNPVYFDTALTAIFGHEITSSADANITINPVGDTPVDYGDDITINYAPNNSDYCVDEVLVDGTDQGFSSSYTFNNVIENHTIEVTERDVYTVSATIKPDAIKYEAHWRAVDDDTGAAFTGWLQDGDVANIPCGTERVRVEFDDYSPCYDSPHVTGQITPSVVQNANAATPPTPVEFTGTYSKISYDLTLGMSGGGTGEVSAAPDPPGGTGAGTYSFACGEEVTVTGSADPDSDFIQWSGNVDDPGNYTTTITMYNDETVTAVFDELTYTLSLSVSGGGVVSPVTGSHEYSPDTEVSLIATPNPNWTFQYWTGDVDNTTSPSTSILMNADQTVTAVFSTSQNPNIDNDGDGYTPAQGDCNDNDADIYPGATEICGDGIDQSCSGSDAICPDDNDGDGFIAADDCNDNDPTIYPGAPETCGDGIIQDCDRSTDLPCDPNLMDGDNDGFSPAGGDCDDSDSTIHPGATDICGDGIDQDCYGGDSICDVADTCVTISDIPLNSEIQAPPPNVMFLLDDSGSMDFTILMMSNGETDGVFRGYQYVFDDPGDNVYNNRFPLARSERRFWVTQWSEANALWYDPTSYYFPWVDHNHTWDPSSFEEWPSLPDADMDNPRSNPLNASHTFNLASTSTNGGVDATTYYTTLYESGGQRVTIQRDSNSNRDVYESRCNSIDSAERSH